MENELGSQAKPFRLGSQAPNFEAETTKGRINFYDYVGESWAILFCYPLDFAPVATSELSVLAKLQPQFEERDVKLLALSTNTVESHQEWAADVEGLSGESLRFPIIADVDGKVAHLYHVLDPSDVEDITSESKGLAFETRSVLIISPEKKFKMSFNYPASVGMYIAELVRVVDCLQLVSNRSIRTPANWMPGSDVVVAPWVTDEKAKEEFPGFRPVKPYLRFVEFPVTRRKTGHIVYNKGSLKSFGAEGESLRETIDDEVPMESGSVTALT